MKKKNSTTEGTQAVIDGIVITDDTQEKGPLNEKRIALTALSAQLKPLVAAGKFSNLNEALIASYKNDQHTEFKTYQQWRKDGFQVKKGSTSFCIWGKPLSKRAEEKGEQLPEDQHDYFPICFLFSNAQVRQLKTA